MENRPQTLGALKTSGYRDRTVKAEMRDNLVRMIRGSEELFPGIVGYEKTVIPGIVNAVLSQHDFILLGLRGQAKTRMLRSLVRLLDDELPVIEGADINDNPLQPVTKEGRRIVAELGDDAPIRWITREERYQEKLATPDVTISDLIGDIDPIKAATLRLAYSDEDVIHYGIIPRTNRGIFTINELPDLPPRIQVGLLNIMEEKDIQIRGFPVRMPLDICMVFSANPEDYTNRGNIITPLKDRIDSQIITHYPEDMEHAIAITAQEAWTDRGGDLDLKIPTFFRELIEDVAFEARKSEFVDQKSGVSARMTIALLENVLSNMERRALVTGETIVYPRLSDLHTALTAITGKVELVYEGEQEGPQLVARKIIGQAVRSTFRRHFPKPDTKTRDPERGKPVVASPYQAVVTWFSKGNTVDTSDDLPTDEYLRRFEQVDGLRKLATKEFELSDEREAGLGMEIVLEGLHQHSMISKRNLDSETSYRDMLKAMFDQMNEDDES